MIYNYYGSNKFKINVETGKLKKDKTVRYFSSDYSDYYTFLLSNSLFEDDDSSEKLAVIYSDDFVEDELSLNNIVKSRNSHILIVSEKKINIKSIKKSKSDIIYMKCEPYTKEEFSSLANSILRIKKKDIKQSDLKKIIDECDLDGFKLYNSIVLYIASENTVLPSYKHPTYIWNFINGFTSRNKNLYKTELKTLIEKNGEDFFYISTMLVWAIRLLILLKSNHGNTSIISKSFGVSPYALSNLQRNINSYSLDELILFLNKINTIEYKIKTGVIREETALCLLKIL